MAWPTTDRPRRKFVSLRLADDEYIDLERVAQQEGRPRSEVVRDAVNTYVQARLKPARRGGSTKGGRP